MNTKVHFTNPICIAREAEWWHGRKELSLAPPDIAIYQLKHGMIDTAKFLKIYDRVLDKIPDWQALVKDLGEDATLLCYEKPPENPEFCKLENFCHRHHLAKRITKETGVVVEEYKSDPKGTLQEWFT